MATTSEPASLFPELEWTPEDAERPDWDSVEYPTSDGLQLLGTSWHEVAIFLAREALDRHFRDRDDLFIATTMALYYEKGDKSSCLIPDVMVAFDVPGYGRPVYKTWQERQVPQFVLEVASRSTKDRDCKFKKDEYESIGVKEYWQLDQTGVLLNRPLIGYRLRRGVYQTLPPCSIRDGEYEYRSKQLGLLLRKKPYKDGLTVAFYDRRTGQDILTGEDMDRALRAERQARLAAEERSASDRRARREAEKRAETAEKRSAVDRQAKVMLEGRVATAEAETRRARKQVAELMAQLERSKSNGKDRHQSD